MSPTSTDSWPTVASCSFLVTAVLVPVLRSWALSRGLTDVPNERSSHKTPKPRTGGIGIVLGSFAGLLTAWYQGQWTTFPITLSLVLLGLSLVGLVDDVRPLPAAIRMPLYLVGAAVLAAGFSHVDSLVLPGATLELGGALGLVFSTLFVAWYANLFNFMDGVDGIAGGAACVTGSALAVTFARAGAPGLGLFSLGLAAATLGFLLYNYPPSSVFMGDSGSVFLGAACGALSCAAVAQGALSLLSSVLIMFPFVFDATFTLFRRAVRGEKVWRAHRTHIYQQMCDIGLSHREVTICYTVLGVICAFLGLVLDELSTWAQWFAVALSLLFASTVAAVVLRKNRARFG